MVYGRQHSVAVVAHGVAYVRFAEAADSRLQTMRSHRGVAVPLQQLAPSSERPPPPPYPTQGRHTAGCMHACMFECVAASTTSCLV